MMFKIKLLKDWLDGQTSYKAGMVLEVDRAIAGQLLLDGIAEKYVEPVKAIEPPIDIAAIAKEEISKALGEFNKKVDDLGGKIGKVQDKEDPRGGFKHFGHFVQDVARASRQNPVVSTELRKWTETVRTKTAGHLAESDDSQGGYLVPTEFVARLLMKMQEAAIVRPRATFIPMATNQIQLPYIAESTRATTLFGGIVLYRPDEAVAKTPSKPLFGKLSLNLHKVCGLIYVSDELLEDSPISIEPLVNTLFAQAFAFQEDEDFINGNGVGQPLGALNSGCLVSVAKETGQTAATIVYANIVKMWARLYAPSQANAVWIANSDTFPQLAQMSLAVGTGGAPAYLPANGLAGAPYGLLLGRPLILTEHCQTLGTVGDIMICDWSQYLIGGKQGGGVQTATSVHIKFVEDETAFRFVLRYDGQPWWKTTLTPKHSAATVSPFVAIATRA